jgi:membrane protease YdiL (CAAX protease family)
MKVSAVLKPLGLMLLGMIVFVVILSVVQIPLRIAHVPDAAGAVVVVAVALAIYLGWVRYVERRRATEFELAAAGPEIAGGLVLGVGLFSLVIGVLAVLGVFTVAGWGSWTAAAVGLVGALATAVVEEILFRGWLFRVVRDVGGTWLGVAVSALLFGLLHALNPGASATSTIAIALEAGVLLALAYAATNRLWVPIGLHAGWNFAEGSIFGTPVSGHAPVNTLLNGMLHGPTTLTGGIFGPEASLVAVVVCVLAAAVFAAQVATANTGARDR